MAIKHVDFITIREDLSVYEIDNGQIVKAKQILTDIIEGEDKKGKYGNLGFQTVSHVISPENMDVSNLELASPEQVTNDDVIKDLNFKVKKQVINIYETEDVIILIKPEIEKIRATNKKDKENSPILRIRTGMDVNVIPKNPVRK